MHMQAVTVLLSCVVFAACAVYVDIPDGRIKGYQKTYLNSNQKVSVFQGIPYAKPPLNDLRFKRPEPPTPWNGTLDATKDPNSCEQGPFTVNLKLKWLQRLTTISETSEDCLYLNIWTSAQINNKVSSAQRPVIFWIHGGGFISGSSTRPMYDGTVISHIEKVVFVSINYRLGPLGFLYLGNDEIPGNMALYDMVLALDWVKSNIEAFGGNPNDITIIGESAGGASVSALLLSPISRDKFKNAVVQSGTMLAAWSYKSKQDALKQTKHLATAVGCIKEDSNQWHTKESIPKNLASCLQKRYVEQLFQDGNYTGTGVEFAIPFPPTIDGIFFPDSPRQMLIMNNIKKNSSIMVGHTSKEGAIFALASFKEQFLTTGDVFVSKFVAKALIKTILPFLNDISVDIVQHLYTNWSLPEATANQRDNIVDFLGDAAIVCPNIAFALAASKSNKVYYYVFDHRPKINYELPAWTGAMHTDEIQFFFGSVMSDKFDFSDSDKRISTNMMTHLKNFASNGEPAKPDIWPPFNSSEQRVNIYGLHSNKGSAPRARECTFYFTLLEKLKALSEQEKLKQENAKLKMQANGVPGLTQNYIFIPTLLLYICKFAM